MMKWLYKLGSPKHFYEMSTSWVKWLAWVAAVLTVVGIIWGLMFSPPDYQMGHNYRIIYIHVPMAMMMEGCMWMLALLSLGVLVWNIKMADMAAKSAAPVGAWATALTLATGSLWGIPTWGTWWIWDARLTSSLIQLFIFLAIIALRAAIPSQDNAAKACAVFTLVGVVNIPIIKYSVVWWNTLHQPASNLAIRDSAANPPDIWIPAIFTGFGMIAFFFLLVFLRTRNEILQREKRAAWVMEIARKAAAGGQI